MSGIGDVLIEGAVLLVKGTSMMYKQYKQLKGNTKRENQAIEWLSQKRNIEGIQKDIESIQEDLKQLQETDDYYNQLVIKSQIDEIIEVCNELNDFEKYKNRIESMINHLSKTTDNLERINQVIGYKMKIEEWIEEERENGKILEDKYKKLGIESEEDFEDETKARLILMYENLSDLGYNPQIDDDGNIIVVKDDGNQIIAENRDDKINLHFDNYEGKSCIKDIYKIEQHLRTKGIIQPSHNLYVKWHTQEQHKNGEKIYLKNKRIYEELEKKTKAKSTNKTEESNG